MPQLAKGGKYIFGWCIIGEDGSIALPEEARQEYKFQAGERVILLPGSHTSGGFSIARKSIIEQSRLSHILAQNTDLAEFRIKEGKTINIGGKSLCWIAIRNNGQLLLPPQTLEAYGVKPSDYLLAGRGSYVGLAMVVKGSIVDEARKHSEIAVFKAGLA